MATISNTTARIQKPAPTFTNVKAVVDGKISTISLSDYLGKYVVFFFYPLDFTFVCPSEIIAYSDAIDKFRELDAEVIACSTDSAFSHLAWVNTPRSEGGLGRMEIPIVADYTKEIARAYNVLLEDGDDAGVALRGIFIISPTGILRQITVNDLPVGRSVDETLRLLQAFKFTDEHGEVCPANWTPGANTIIPDPEDKLKYFAKENTEAPATAGASTITEITSEAQFNATLNDAGKNLVVVDFWAPWCGKCKQLMPDFERLAGVHGSKAVFCKFNTTKNEDLSMKLGVSALPTFMFYKDGKKVDTYEGSKLEKFEEKLTKLL